jgi:hypothetical protein
MKMGLPDELWTPEYLREKVKQSRWSPAKAKEYLLRACALIEKLANAKTDKGRIAAWKKVKDHMVGPYNEDMSSLLRAAVIQHLPENYWAEDIARMRAEEKASIEQWRKENPDWKERKAEMEATLAQHKGSKP